jgi:hypothetical protein
MKDNFEFFLIPEDNFNNTLNIQVIISFSKVSGAKHFAQTFSGPYLQKESLIIAT